MCTILRVFTKIVYKNLSQNYKKNWILGKQCSNSKFHFFFRFLTQCESKCNRCTDDEENDITQKGRTTASTKVFLPSLSLAGAFLK